jgi:hypothetical protein
MFTFVVGADTWRAEPGAPAALREDKVPAAGPLLEHGRRGLTRTCDDEIRPNRSADKGNIV